MAAKVSDEPPSLPPKISQGNGSKSQKGFFGSSKTKRCQSFPLSSSSSAQELRSLEDENESSPKGVIEACMNNGENNEVPKSHETKEESQAVVVSPNLRAQSSWNKFFKMWKKSTMKRLPSFPPFSVPRLSRRKCRSMREDADTDMNLCSIKSPWKFFTLDELKTATNDFSEENLIGKGGCAEVYKGCLADGRFIAVKRMNKGTLDDSEDNFLAEVGTIAHVDHPNTAKMIGYGVEGGAYLVLKLSSQGSLGSILRGPREKLDWEARYKIILGISDGLLYLHNTCRRRIIHRDIKADNVLLTEDFVPEICDFGLAKWLPKEWTHHNVSNFEGTFGYFAPEYFLHGTVDEKTDVYSFGVLLLEIITGRRAVDESQKSIVLWAKPLLDTDDTKDLVDPLLGDCYDKKQMDHVFLTASLCVEQNPILRPWMRQVVTLLRGDKVDNEGSKENEKRGHQRTYSEEIFDAEEYNLTKHLSDLERHQQLALDS